MTGKFNGVQEQWYPEEPLDYSEENCQQCLICRELFPPQETDGGLSVSDSVIAFDHLPQSFQKFVDSDLMVSNIASDGDGEAYVCCDCFNKYRKGLYVSQ